MHLNLNISYSLYRNASVIIVCIEYSSFFFFLLCEAVVIVVVSVEILVVVDVFIVTSVFVAEDAVSEFVDDAFWLLRSIMIVIITAAIIRNKSKANNPLNINHFRFLSMQENVFWILCQRRGILTFSSILPPNFLHDLNQLWAFLIVVFWNILREEIESSLMKNPSQILSFRLDWRSIRLELATNDASFFYEDWPIFIPILWKKNRRHDFVFFPHGNCLLFVVFVCSRSIRNDV